MNRAVADFLQGDTQGLTAAKKVDHTMLIRMNALILTLLKSTLVWISDFVDFNLKYRSR